MSYPGDDCPIDEWMHEHDRQAAGKPAPAEGEPSYLTDLRLASLLFMGRAVRPSGKGKREAQREYLEGQEEVAGREALARLLRSGDPLDSHLRRCLADHLDPACPAERALVFRRPRKGAPRAGQYDAEIATEVLMLLYAAAEKGGRLPLEEAVASIADEWKMSERKVMGIWSEHSHFARGITKRGRPVKSARK